MNDTAVSQMLAGRELNALVAEKVMGWTLGEPQYVMGWLGHGGSMMRLYSGPGIPGPNREMPGEEWSPSTNIAAAWEVVEKVLYPRGWYLAPMPETEGKGWGVFEEDWHEIAQGDTAPLAICRAALKAVAP